MTTSQLARHETSARRSRWHSTSAECSQNGSGLETRVVQETALRSCNCQLNVRHASGVAHQKMLALCPQGRVTLSTGNKHLPQLSAQRRVHGWPQTSWRREHFSKQRTCLCSRSSAWHWSQLRDSGILVTLRGHVCPQATSIASQGRRHPPVVSRADQFNSPSGETTLSTPGSLTDLDSW